MFDRFRRIRRTKRSLLLAALLCLVSFHASADSAIYGGGPFYHGGQPVMDDLRASGFTTVILFGVHVQTDGDLHFNNDPIISNGTYIGDPGWPARLATLKTAPTSVTRIEASVGGWGTGDFQNIKNLIAAQGTGPTSVLYKNFQTLKQVTGADAIDFDDESTYDLGSSTAFGNMLWGLGYSITLAPYTNMTYWKCLADNLAGKVDGIHLQVYDGGSGNNPATWSTTLGMAVDPGVWSKHGSGCTAGDSPATVQSKMTNWKNSAGIVGGFIWLYDDVQACWSQGTTAQYAGAINAVFGGNAAPVVNFSSSVARVHRGLLGRIHRQRRDHRCAPVDLRRWRDIHGNQPQPQLCRQWHLHRHADSDRRRRRHREPQQCGHGRRQPGAQSACDGIDRVQRQ